MNRFKKYFLILPVVVLTSCGASVDYLVPGNKYNSPIFVENYYTHWDSELKNAKKVDAKDMTDVAINKFSDLYKVDPNIDTGIVSYDDANAYGADYKMNKVDDSFNYGYQSKLFDGQMVCGRQNDHPEYAYQLGRIQTNPKGFSVRFAKESDKLHYFAMQFKATTNDTIDCYPVDSEEISHYGTTVEEHDIHDRKILHDSTIELKTTIYTKKDSSIIAHPYLTTVVFDNNHTNNGSFYIFLAFSLEEENLRRAVGVSFEFTVVSDALIEWNKTKGIDNIDYALFLYEVILPYTEWH